MEFIDKEVILGDFMKIKARSDREFCSSRMLS